MNRLVFIVLCGGVTVTLAARQAAPAFEVVSIKRNVSGDAGSSMAVQPGRLSVVNLPVRQIIVRAFGVQPFQITGGPDWLQTERYNIQARAPEGSGTTGEAIDVMLRAMLADRFKLKARRETSDSPIYELVVARGDRRLGEKLHATSAECVADLGRGTQPGGSPATLPGPGGPIPCGMIMSGGNRLAAGGQTMTRLAAMLGPRVQRTVVDKTGLTGLYDFDLQFLPDQAGPTADGPVRMYNVASDVPPLMTAIQDQLGLKLQTARGAVEHVVIEGIERPSED